MDALHIAIYKRAVTGQTDSKALAVKTFLYLICLLHTSLGVFCCLIFFFSKLTFYINSFRHSIRVSNYVGPDLGPNCLQRLSVDNLRRPTK